jgi:hypothetical protein
VTKTRLRRPMATRSVTITLNDLSVCSRRFQFEMINPFNRVNRLTTQTCVKAPPTLNPIIQANQRWRNV